MDETSIAEAAAEQVALDDLAEHAARLTGAGGAAVWRREGPAMRVAGAWGPRSRDAIEADGLPVPQGAARVHRCEPGGEDGSDLLCAPIGPVEEPLGAVSAWQAQAGRFTAADAERLRSIAGLAQFAMQHRRLAGEARTALERQAATAEILQLIGSSADDTAPVFEKILDSCQRLFATSQLGVFVVGEDGLLQAPAWRGEAFGATAASFPKPLAQTATGVVIARRGTLHYARAASVPDAPLSVREAARKIGDFSIAWAPMLWKDSGVGSIAVLRQPPRPFDPDELALLQTLADQATIAIQNARLFHEIEDKGRQLEVANRHKSEFLANMSHELRTPLNAIIGFSEALIEQMFGTLNPKQQEYLHDIHASGYHLLQLINDILDLSKIEAGRMELDLGPVELPSLLDNALSLVRERASRQGLDLALDLEAGLDLWVADERKVKQVVINLLSNAVKFTPAGGRVRLRARRVEGALEVAVEDNGVGIAKDQQELVFQEFHQAGGDRLRRAEGTGLGLSLARRLVELHGGTIRVDSAPGRGSIFAFTLPARTLEMA